MNLNISSPPSIQAYTTRLRRRLLAGNPLETLLELHDCNQEMLCKWGPLVKRRRLHPADGFAWRFINQVEILRPDFKPEAARLRPKGQGVFQNFTQRVLQIKELHFPEMEDMPKVRWLSKFTTRKLAHYNSTKDEVAFSLIFDQLNAPAELLDYLAFHELLHRKVGIIRENGRVKAHTPVFKAEERRYPGFAQMDQKIHQFISEHQSPTPL